MVCQLCVLCNTSTNCLGRDCRNWRKSRHGDKSTGFSADDLSYEATKILSPRTCFSHSTISCSGCFGLVPSAVTLKSWDTSVPQDLGRHHNHKFLWVWQESKACCCPPPGVTFLLLLQCTSKEVGTLLGSMESQAEHSTATHVLRSKIMHWKTSLFSLFLLQAQGLPWDTLHSRNCRVELDMFGSETSWR